MRVFFLGLVALVAAASWAGIRIGNGGDGICKGKTDKETKCYSKIVYVRDLYDANLHLNPAVGNEIDPYIQREVDQSSVVSTLQLDKNLLARKLTDLEHFHLHFGHIVLAAINAYQWQLVENPLEKLADDAPIEQRPESWRVQLANRFQNTIRVYSDDYALLPEIHKVALVIHEGIFSLLSPQCRKGICTQHAYMAREITANAFRDSRGDEYHLTPAQLGQLSIQNSEFLGQEHRYTDNNLKLEIYRKSLVAEDYLVQYANDDVSRGSFVAHLCALINHPSKVIVHASRRPFKLKQWVYPSDSGTSDQAALSAYYRWPIFDQTYQFGNSIECFAKIQSDLASWYTEL